MNSLNYGAFVVEPRSIDYNFISKMTKKTCLTKRFDSKELVKYLFSFITFGWITYASHVHIFRRISSVACKNTHAHP